MDGLKELTKSKKFWSAILSLVVIVGEVTFLKGNPHLMDIVFTTAGIFGLQIAGQAHADANDENYKSKKKI